MNKHPIPEHLLDITKEARKEFIKIQTQSNTSATIEMDYITVCGESVLKDNDVVKFTTYPVYTMPNGIEAGKEYRIQCISGTSFQVYPESLLAWYWKLSLVLSSISILAIFIVHP